jgi:hypothetical protein
MKFNSVRHEDIIIILKFILMKTTSLFIILYLTACMRMPAQNSACDKIFETYADRNGFNTLNFSGNLFSKMFADGKSSEKWNISSVKILVAEDSVINSKLNFYKEIVPDLNRKGYEELMKVKNKKENFIILFKEENNRVTEIICVSGGKDNALIYLKGSIPVSQLQDVSDAVTTSEKSFGM